MSKTIFSEPRSSWASKNNDLRNVRITLEGRTTLADLLDHLQQVAPNVAAEDIGISFGTITWSRLATEEELSDRAVRLAADQKRKEEWQRKTLKFLIDEYPEDAAEIVRSRRGGAR